ncbi:Eukaryotic translation initiation factor eIF-1 [Coemansia sp. RSA 2399]|nr:Eukaryotic translation initiation factor eIF-1 [Coemansia sp. RSA 2399]KAJ1885763.1 Eukaryotic translation initiation factor eIF-1 [Coemansia sp. IMI 209127]
MNSDVEAERASAEPQDVEKSKKKKKSKSKKVKEVADDDDDEGSVAGKSDSEGEEKKKKKKKSKKRSKKSLSSKADDEDLEAMMAGDDEAFGGDPFDKAEQFGGIDAFDETAEDKEMGMDYIHLRIRIRKGRKMLTTIQGLPEMFDYKKLVKHFRSAFSCMGVIIEDKAHVKTIELSGDQRALVREFLISEEIATAETIKTHGI